LCSGKVFILVYKNFMRKVRVTDSNDAIGAPSPSKDGSMCFDARFLVIKIGDVWSRQEIEGSISTWNFGEFAILCPIQVIVVKLEVRMKGKLHIATEKRWCKL
jgi:hypothetical protein